MKGLGGLRPLEIGQSAVKAITDDVKQSTKVAGSQITGKAVQSQTNPNPLPLSSKRTPKVRSLSGREQPKAPDAMGDFSNLLEQNQTQQNQSSNVQQPQMPSSINLEEKFAPQQKKDQAELEAARKNIQQIEEEMEKYRKLREQKEEQEEVQEEQEKEQEELWKKEEQKQQPVTAGQRSGEAGAKNKG